ncbi:MAG: hypothetical protein KatS3mg094_023 [Candidatus Parcubacteria bacterium]|nr:MAG: hypothetical protein KatS3mg094_023 [Candidatus Parcubacteria bacterium]
MKKISIFLILGILIFSQIIFAATNSKVSLTIPDRDVYLLLVDGGRYKPNLLPTSPFYFTKELWRGIKLFFTFDPVKKADLESQIADEKLAELVKVYETSKSKEALQKAIQNYIKSKERLANRIKSLEVNPKVEELITKISERNTQHLILFDELIAKERDQLIIDDLIQARQASDAVTANQVDKSWRAAQAGIDNALNTLPYEEGIKELKALEVLTRIEEKLPEEAKKGIKTAKENIEKRLIEEGKIEKILRDEESTAKIEETGGGTSVLPQSSEGKGIKKKDFSTMRVEGGSDGKSTDANWIIIKDVPLSQKALESVIDKLEEKAKKSLSVSQKSNIVNIEALKETVSRKYILSETKDIKIKNKGSSDSSEVRKNSGGVVTESESTGEFSGKIENKNTSNSSEIRKNSGGVVTESESTGERLIKSTSSEAKNSRIKQEENQSINKSIEPIMKQLKDGGDRLPGQTEDETTDYTE